MACEITEQWKMSPAMMHLDICLRVAEEAVAKKVCQISRHSCVELNYRAVGRKRDD